MINKRKLIIKTLDTLIAVVNYIYVNTFLYNVYV